MPNATYGRRGLDWFLSHQTGDIVITYVVNGQGGPRLEKWTGEYVRPGPSGPLVEGTGEQAVRLCRYEDIRSIEDLRVYARLSEDF